VSDADALSEFALELKIAPPFDMEPIIRGEASVLDSDIQRKILKHVEGTVLIASCKVVVPEVLLFHNYGVRWFCTTVVCDPERACGAEEISNWEMAHAELMRELLRYCEEQARNAVAIGADDAAKLWISAKSRLSVVNAAQFIGKEADCDMMRNNCALYDGALSDAVQAATIQDQALQLAELRGDDIGEKIAARRTLWLKQHDIPDENPFTRKFVAWGAESTEKIPSWCLMVKDGMINKELFERNLKIVGRDYSDLYGQLNANVKRFMQGKADELRHSLNECMTGALHEGESPIKALDDLLDSVDSALSGGGYYDDGSHWDNLLGVALGLPRYRLYYYDWASHHEDEGPTEPGLFFDTADGRRHEVHYDTVESDWWQGMDMVEFRIDNLIRKCNALALKLGIEAVVNEWFEIERKWRECRGSSDSGTSYHCIGDLAGFASSFYQGIKKMMVVLPKVSVEGKNVGSRPIGDMPEDEYFRRLHSELGVKERHARVLAAVTQYELAILLGYKNQDSVRKWESGDRSAPDGYSRDLRLRGGLELMAFINDFRKSRGIKAPLQAIKNGKVVDLSKLSEADADLVLELVRKKTQKAERKEAEEAERSRRPMGVR